MRSLFGMRRRRKMTLQALQEYLDVVKWKDSEKIHADMCGRYARCRYCTRTEDFPCARAHNRLAEMMASPVQDRIPEWLLPEPEIDEDLLRAQSAEEPAAETPAEKAPAEEPAWGSAAETSEEAPAEAQETDAALQPSPEDTLQSAQEADAEQRGEMPPLPEEPRLTERPRPHVIVRGYKGETRICTLQRKLPKVSDVVSE